MNLNASNSVEKKERVLSEKGKDNLKETIKDYIIKNIQIRRGKFRTKRKSRFIK